MIQEIKAILEKFQGSKTIRTFGDFAKFDGSKIAAASKGNTKAAKTIVATAKNCKPGLKSMTLTDLLCHSKINTILEAIAKKNVSDNDGSATKSATPTTTTKKSANNTERAIRIEARRYLAENPDSRVHLNDVTVKFLAHKMVGKRREEIRKAVYAELESKDDYRKSLHALKMELENRGWDIAPRPKEGQAPTPTNARSGLVGNVDFSAMVSIMNDENIVATAAEAADEFGFATRKSIETVESETADFDLDLLLGNDETDNEETAVDDLL